MDNDTKSTKKLVLNLFATVVIILSIIGFIIILYTCGSNHRLDVSSLILGLSLSIIPYVIFRCIECLTKQ